MKKCSKVALLGLAGGGMTPEGKRAYARGYNRSNSRALDRTRKALRIAKGYRDRLADMDMSRVCGSCERWTRGGSNCLWGKCDTQSFFYEAGEQAMWADRFVGESADRPVITQEKFGCVNWLPRAKDGPA